MNTSSFSDYETHFTVMNYKEGVIMTNKRWFDFMKEFDEEHSGVSFENDVLPKVHEAIKTIFIAFQS